MKTTQVPAGIPVPRIKSGMPFLPKEHVQEAWWASQRKMVASIPGAVLIVADRSSHMIPFDQPDLVVEAVEQVVAEVRALK